MKDWLVNHMENILWVIEVLWVAGVLAIFVLYFMVKRHFKQKKSASENNTDAS
jgi:hypothetical protein